MGIEAPIGDWSPHYYVGVLKIYAENYTFLWNKNWTQTSHIWFTPPPQKKAPPPTKTFPKPQHWLIQPSLLSRIHSGGVYMILRRPLRVYAHLWQYIQSLDTSLEPLHRAISLPENMQSEESEFNLELKCLHYTSSLCYDATARHYWCKVGKLPTTSLHRIEVILRRPSVQLNPGTRQTWRHLRGDIHGDIILRRHTFRGVTQGDILMRHTFRGFKHGDILRRHTFRGVPHHGPHGDILMRHNLWVVIHGDFPRR